MPAPHHNLSKTLDVHRIGDGHAPHNQAAVKVQRAKRFTTGAA